MASPSALPRGWMLFGIPLHIDPSWLFIVALVTWSLSQGYFPARLQGLPVALYWLLGGTAAILLFVCVLLHELGHSLAAKSYGIPVTRVILFIFGGVAQIAHDPKRPMVELVVALAGPVVSVVIAGTCYWAATVIPLQHDWQLVLTVLIQYLAVINTWLLLFNLLPGFPLDGGRILRAVLWAWTGRLGTATRISAHIGSGLGIGLMVLGGWVALRGVLVPGLWYIYLGWYLRNAARMSARQAHLADGG